VRRRPPHKNLEKLFLISSSQKNYWPTNMYVQYYVVCVVTSVVYVHRDEAMIHVTSGEEKASRF
jgi:hypothetical protein